MNGVIFSVCSTCEFFQNARQGAPSTRCPVPCAWHRVPGTRPSVGPFGALKAGGLQKKVRVKKGGAQKSGARKVGPEGCGPPRISLFSSCLWGSSRGIVAAVQGHGPPEVRVWARNSGRCGRGRSSERGARREVQRMESRGELSSVGWSRP